MKIYLQIYLQKEFWRIDLITNKSYSMDLNKIIEQAAAMKKQMEDMQKEISSEKFEGKSGGGLVTILMGGTGEMFKVNIDESLIKDGDKEVLEDLIVAAYNDSKKKADNASKERMNNAFGAFGGSMPPGMKFPF